MRPPAGQKIIQDGVKEEGTGCMHRQANVRQDSGQLRMVRLSPHDSRVRAYKAKSRKKNRMALALGALCLICTCLCGIYFGFMVRALDDKILAEAEEQVGEKMPEEILGEPEAVDPGDIVVLEENQEIHIPLVAIDAGHGGEDDGCCRDGVSESAINLEIARCLSEELKALGMDTLMIRENEENQMSLEERVEKAEEAGADIYVSIHQNACEEEESSVSGIETWYYGDSQDSRRLAQLVHKGAVEKTDAVDRQIQETDTLYVVRETSMPSCLIETGFLSNTAERNALVSPEYQEKLAKGIAWGIQYYFQPKTMYLTFDDGPSEENTRAILDILKERNIKATFFVVGENVEKHPEVARRIVEEGHTMGIHCYSHDYKKIYQSAESYLADFQEAYDTVYETTGVKVTLFRFPGGSINSYNQNVYEEIIGKMTEDGFIYFDWNGSLEDAVKNSTPEKIVRNAVNSTLGRKKVVMLGHDIVYNTTLCLEEILDSLPEYEMLPLTSEVAPIQF